MTPITMPAIAPPLSPPPDVCDAPLIMAPLVPVGVWNGTVLAAVPVDVRVVVVPVVGRRGAPAVLVAVLVTVTVAKLL